MIRPASSQDENDRLKRQLAELRNENDSWSARHAKVRKERDCLKAELDEWKDGEGRRAAVLGRDLSGKSVSTETQKLLNAVAGHTENRENVRLRDELYKTKDCVQHVQRLAKEHIEDYETVVSAGRRGDLYLNHMDDSERKMRLRAMVRNTKVPGKFGWYQLGFQMGMLSAGRMYHDFAHAIDDEYDKYAECWCTPDDMRADARDMFPNCDA